MRTSTRTPRMSWFPCTPVDFLTDSDFLAMSAAAAGAYFKLMLYGWNAYTQGSGLSADPASLQRVTGMSSLEWDAVREQVLAHFKVRDDGTLYLPWQWDAAENATEKVRKLRESATAAAEAKSKIAQSKKIDEIDEIRLYKNGRPNGHTSSSSQVGQSSPSDSPAVSSASSSSSLVQKTDSDSDSSSESSSVDSSCEGIGKDNPDVQAIQEYSAELGWKIPSTRVVQNKLADYPDADAICAAMERYNGTLNSTSDYDAEHAEFNFFHDGGCEAMMQVLTREEARKAARQ
jgi:uncharacterized protein YdaU (DUF1376 family)